MFFFRKLFSKIKASFYVFKKSEILKSIVNKEIDGEYDNLCHRCFFNERYQKKALVGDFVLPEGKLRLSIYLGGALGDYIVYLQFVDEISSICECTVDIFLDRIEFGNFVFGKRENVTIVHDAENCLFLNSVDHYDLALHLDHGVTLKHCELGAIRRKAPEFYKTACKIVEHCKSHAIDIANQWERESVILRRAKFFGETKWSQLSCSGAIDMDEMYSNILLNMEYLAVLERYCLSDQKYITINYGADKNMGGTAQTKVLPRETLQTFITKFKTAHPDYLVVQTGMKNSFPLDGADRYAFNCKLEETAILLKYSSCHVDSEGGLVHLASQLSTPCVVSFGPTPIYYYGYLRNENILSPVCNNCMSTTGNWSKVCPRGMQIPACMQAITPEMILERTEKILNRVKDDPIAIKTVQENTFSAGIFPSIGKVKKICMIGPLTKTLCGAIKDLWRSGNMISVFIPLQISEEVIKMRSDLRDSGVSVEYGNAFNIAGNNQAFDMVLYCGDWIDPALQKYAEREWRRLVSVDGEIICIKEKPSKESKVYI